MADARVFLHEGRLGREPPHVVHEETGFRVWYLAPLGMLTQVGEVTDAGDSVAEFLSKTAFERLEQRRSPGDRYVFLHDWRRLTGYTPGARKIMTDWGMRVRAETDRITIALSPGGKVVKMGVSVATMALQVAGFSVSVVDDLQAIIDEMRVRPSDPG